MSLLVDIRKRLGPFQLSIKFSAAGTLAILGASGCGKSLTLQAIAGILKPDEGIIVLNDRVLFDSSAHVDLPPQKRQVGFLFQNGALFPHMTVRQNIALGARHLPKRAAQQLAEEWAARLQLEPWLDARPDTLSGGQRQRAALARVLIGEPEILLLDEPFSALDNFLREKLMADLVEFLHRWGKDAVLVTHSRDEAYALCENLAIMKEGRILNLGPTKALFANPLTATGAVLTGCKNVVAAEVAAAGRLYVPDWGVDFLTTQPLDPDIRALGIRAHQFGPKLDSNRHSVRITETVEEPFGWIHRFRFADQNPHSDPVWWRLAKGKTVPKAVHSLGVNSEDVLPLRGE